MSNAGYILYTVKRVKVFGLGPLILCPRSIQLREIPKTQDQSPKQQKCRDVSIAALAFEE
jgi:hypothetical protein